MKVITKALGAGISLTAIETTKFKSATLSATFLTPLDKDAAAVNAAVPYILRRGCKSWPTMDAVSARLEELYGGMLEPMVVKRAETQGLCLVGRFLDDPYTLEGESVLEPVAQLLGELVLEPVTEKGAFRADYVAGERENLLQAIRAQMNDKRQYAVLRLVQEMCAGEPYGVDRLGGEEDMAAVTPQSAWAAYRALLASARVELFYCGSAPIQRVCQALAPLVAGLEGCRGRVRELSCRVHSGGGAPRQVADHMDVTQGKLVLGFRGGEAFAGADHLAQVLVFNALYGGTATSKLFLNVRERLSLCYYASSAGENSKGIVTVSSGVEFDKMAQAQEEILAQLEAIKAGDFTGEELESARQSVINSCKSALDSPAVLQTYWTVAAITGNRETPQERVERVERVTAEEVARLAGALELDTVYRLMGKEGRAHD